MEIRFIKDHWRFSAWHIPLILGSITMLVPLIFMFNVALAPNNGESIHSTQLSSLLIPQHWEWGNFIEVWNKIPFLRYYINSLIVASVSTLGEVTTCALAAYAFARLQWPGRDAIFFLYLATIMVPGAVTMIPNFILMKLLPEIMGGLASGIDWRTLRHVLPDANSPAVGRLVGLDSYFALIAPGMFSAYGTFLLRQFLIGIPDDFENAARIDGASHLRIFWSITLPLAIPGIATLTLLSFISSWGSFMWPLVTTNQESLYTLTVGLQSFRGQYGTEWNLMMAASILMLLPIVILFSIGQRYIMDGLSLKYVQE